MKLTLAKLISAGCGPLLAAVLAMALVVTLVDGPDLPFLAMTLTVLCLNQLALLWALKTLKNRHH